MRVKDKAEHGYYSAESSPEEYATDRTSTFSDSALHEAGHQLDKQGRKAVKETKENISKAKDYFKQKKAEQPIQRAREQAKRAAALPGRRRNRPQGGLFKEKISPSGHERGQSPLSLEAVSLCLGMLGHRSLLPCFQGRYGGSERMRLRDHF